MLNTSGEEVTPKDLFIKTISFPIENCDVGLAKIEKENGEKETVFITAKGGIIDVESSLKEVIHI